MSDGALSRRVSPRFMLVSAAVMLFFHAVVWGIAAHKAARPWSGLLNNWDSSWYTSIITEGYGRNSWAFYPLYPGCVAVLRAIPGLSGIPVPVLGTALSSLLFAAFCLLAARSAARGGDGASILPETRLGWLVLMLSPASYVFHSHHTESLFLLLSFLAFHFCALRKWLPAAMFAGLCALTKNQGIFVAVAAGLWGWAETKGFARRSAVFTSMGVTALLLFSLYPALQYVQEGNPFAFYTSQHHWRPAMDGSSYLKAFWFGNEWQNMNSGSIQRYIAFLALAGSVLLVRARHGWPLAAYTALFVAVMPMSGEFVGTFRYGAVLFPSLFAVGDRTAKMPKWVSWLLLGVLLYLNHRLARHYILNRWSY